MRHRPPFHCSASVRPGLERVFEDPPTAVQTSREGHATDDRKLMSAPTGFGVGSTFQLWVAISLDPPASDAPAMESAVKPNRTVNDPSSRVARRRRAPARGSPLSGRLTASVWLRLGTAPPSIDGSPTNILRRKAASLRLFVTSSTVLAAGGTASVPATDWLSVVSTGQTNNLGSVHAARLPAVRRRRVTRKHGSDRGRRKGCAAAPPVDRATRRPDWAGRPGSRGRTGWR